MNEASSIPPHPPFGHLLPGGEKGKLKTAADLGASSEVPSATLDLLLPVGEKVADRPDEGTGRHVVAVARSFIGTPYRHQGSMKGVGCDCLGLIRGVWRELYGEEPEAPKPYAPDWAERAGEERLLKAAARHCGAALPVSAMRPGDLLIFRWRAGVAAKHAGIAAPDERFIHAYEQAAVIESPLVPSWRRRIAGVFRFPELS